MEKITKQEALKGYQPEPTSFDDRSALIRHVAALSPDAPGKADAQDGASPITGTSAEASRRLESVDPAGYARSRNFLNGKVTMLSPYIRHGMISLDAARNKALSRVKRAADAEKLVQELAWRDYWQRVQRMHPDWLWDDAEAYKTGFAASEYSADLPDDIERGETGVAVIDGIIHELRQTGYIHNHTRMYLAAYIVHWRRVRWQAGARFMLTHLIDADQASNNLSWQWVASTFSRKPYIFNLENVRKYASDQLNTDDRHNVPLAASYEVLTARLFPEMELAPHG